MGNPRQIRRGVQESKWARRGETARRSGDPAGYADLARRHRELDDQFAVLRREHDELRRSIYEAAQMQRRLCGPRHLRREPFEIAGEIFPVRHISGDFVSIESSGSDVILAIGDIASKGLYAGMWLPHIISMVRLRMGASGDPATALSAINSDLLRMSPELPLITLLLARLDVQSGEVTYGNAGHPAPLLLRNGKVEWLREGGLLLGALANASYTNGKITLEPGDTLLGYSDGIAECRNPSGTDFGKERLESAVRQSSESSASGTLFSVLAAAEDFAAGHPREDDMALVVVRRGEDCRDR